MLFSRGTLICRPLSISRLCALSRKAASSDLNLSFEIHSTYFSVLFISERFPTSLNQETREVQICVMDFVSHRGITLVFLAGLRYSPLGYLTLICLHPFIQWLKISST